MDCVGFLDSLGGASDGFLRGHLCFPAFPRYYLLPLLSSLLKLTKSSTLVNWATLLGSGLCGFLRSEQVAVGAGVALQVCCADVVLSPCLSNAALPIFTAWTFISFWLYWGSNSGICTS